MSTMIERIAREICIEDGLSPDGKYKSSNNDPSAAPHEFAWHEYQPHARTAVTAMREPTETMLIAGAKCRTADDRFAEGDDTLAPDFTAMIDAAIKEEPQ